MRDWERGALLLGRENEREDAGTSNLFTDSEGDIFTFFKILKSLLKDDLLLLLFENLIDFY